MRSASALALLLAVAVAVTAAVWTTVDAAASAPPVDAPAPPSAGEVDATDLSRNAAGRVVLGETPFTGTRVAREAGALVGSRQEGARVALGHGAEVHDRRVADRAVPAPAIRAAQIVPGLGAALDDRDLPAVHGAVLRGAPS